MRRISTLLFLLLLLGCTPKEESLISDLENGQLVNATYEHEGQLLNCNPELAQSKLLAWLKSTYKPNLASWANPDNYLSLTFENGTSYKARVFFGGQGGNYSAIRLSNLRIGKPFNYHKICNT